MCGPASVVPRAPVHHLPRALPSARGERAAYASRPRDRVSTSTILSRAPGSSTASVRTATSTARAPARGERSDSAPRWRTDFRRARDGDRESIERVDGAVGRRVIDREHVHVDAVWQARFGAYGRCTPHCSVPDEYPRVLIRYPSLLFARTRDTVAAPHGWGERHLPSCVATVFERRIPSRTRGCGRDEVVAAESVSHERTDRTSPGSVGRRR